MKRSYLLIMVLAIALMGCSSKENKKTSAEMVKNPISGKGVDESVKMPELTFIDEDSDNPQFHDFGVLIQGETVVHTFKYKNTGNTDLIIRSTSSTCGCTVPNYTKEPLAPGEVGKIDVAFASAARKGRQHKAITVLTNAQPASKKLVIEANVVVPN
ncbi:MAG: DUF1573 domain-containing protein [Salinivirgaceae bacterium]